MSALTVMPGPIPSPFVTSQHVCNCNHGNVKQVTPRSAGPITPFQDEVLLTALGLFSKSIIGSSTVAIDNKIEQAMDLVKSHLMFAVREEVDVLKEQIRDLVERMSQLEYENGILRAAATPETLALLAQPRQPPAPSSS